MLRTVILAASAALLAVGCGGGTTIVETTDDVAAPAELIIGGSSANFGAHELTTGFLPDPATYDVVSGGDLDAADAGTDAGCSGWVTAQPDVIVSFTEMSGFLRFAFRASDDGDATLVINDGNGNWHCNDDAVGLNPMVDLADAPAGQYDIWIGSYESGANVQGQLLVTELENVTP